MTDPIIRATTADGEVYDDPSEDALFMFTEDLELPGSSFVVECVESGREGEFLRVSIQQDRTYCLDGPVTDGILSAGSMRPVHERLLGGRLIYPTGAGRFPVQRKTSSAVRQSSRKPS